MVLYHRQKLTARQSLTKQIRIAFAFAVVARTTFAAVPALAGNPPPPPPPTCAPGTVCDDTWMYNN